MFLPSVLLSQKPPMISLDSAKFIMGAGRKEPGGLRRSLTLGRQSLAVPREEFIRFLRHSRVPVPGLDVDECSFEYLLRTLGATETCAMDFSDYEGAELIHDLNQPIPPQWKSRFDFVFDGGTLEHVFDFPRAIRNCMEMLAVGGQFITHTIANNWMGHGFYQFSPELFYRVFSEENGFRIERMIAHEAIPGSAWYEVADPESVKARVEQIGPFRVMLLVQARKIRETEIFRTTPKQSDYAAAWAEAEKGAAATYAETSCGGIGARFLKYLPGVGRALRRHVQPYFRRAWSLRDTRFFKRVVDED